ncbi:hypothetical protein [Micromonospora sp. NPDC004551]|uniref:hypothetical protein n=1 Tax=Micromonospora sp. NPDC004551 TaxID=3154284 RepID=UPI0033A8EAD3
MPATTDPAARRRHTGRSMGDTTLADDVRRAAFHVDRAARNLHALTGDPLWRPKVLTGPTLADLRDARDRLDAVLRQAEPRHLPATPAPDPQVWVATESVNQAEG